MCNTSLSFAIIILTYNKKVIVYLPIKPSVIIKTLLVT